MTDFGARENVVWDAAEGGAGPRMKDGVFSIERAGLLRKLTAILLLNLSMFGVAKAQAPTPPASPSDMNVLLAQGTSTGTVTAPPCVHHDSHNDKIMQSLGGSHVDQHGDLSC